ncbi:Annexin repeat domain containing protein [Trichostrongylus colubriformis]|uniref:Annexin repeat domain containing protein n=1 Tax=Trichostrongylus colubriformis TaxID=6319 RepID=A0AAN8FJ65_TRICO
MVSLPHLVIHDSPEDPSTDSEYTTMGEDSDINSSTAERRVQRVESEHRLVYRFRGQPYTKAKYANDVSNVRKPDTKDQIIVDTVLYHNNFQRQKILSAYEDMYGRKLTDDLEDETGGYFLEMAQALFKPAHQYDTMNLHRSLSNRYADRSVAIEIACTRTARQLRVIRDTYLADYKKTIDKDIVVKVEGVVGRMLTMLLCKSRPEDGRKLDQELVSTHAQLLMKNSIDEIAKNMTLFEQIFVGTSWKHLAAVFDQVDELRSGERDVETMVRKNKMIHSEIRQIFLTIIRVSRNMQLYFAEQLRTALTQERPDHQAIIRITVSRSEIDLYDICEEYKRKYQRALEYDIQQTCSGDYMRLLIALLSASTNNNNHIM